MDWLNPTREMQEGREAGRQDRQNEIDNLQMELDYVQDSLDEYKGETERAYNLALHNIAREARHIRWTIRKMGPGAPAWLVDGLVKILGQWEKAYDLVRVPFVNGPIGGDNENV